MDSREANLLLIGLRGSGKTTLGRGLAHAEGRGFVDLDEVTAAFLGCDSVAEAWGRFGEAEFREAEARALSAVLNDSGRIIALGGGTPTAPGAAAAIAEAARQGRCVVAYLRCPPEVLRARLESQGAEALTNRPSLTGAPALDEIEVVFAARDGLYRRLATWVIEDVGSVDEGLLRLHGWNEARG